MKKTGNVLITVLFLGFILLFSFKTLISQDNEVSSVENRSLSQRPPIDLSTIVNGQFTESFDNYITDQFYLRDRWIKSYLNWQILTDQTFIFDYYIKEDWIYPKPFTTVDKDAVYFAADNIKELSDFTNKRDIELYFFSLPDRRNVLDANYPKWVEESVGQADKNMFMSIIQDQNIDIVDIKEQWDKKYTKEDYKNFYYRTDHHWNMIGAMAGYEVIHNEFYNKSRVFPNDRYNQESYDKQCLLERKFKGVYNQQLYGMFDSSADQICYFYKDDMLTGEWDVYKNGINPENSINFSDLYGRTTQLDQDYANYGEAYTADYSEIHIINQNKLLDQSKVLFLKDSYANPLVPLLADNFYHTTFYDLRHNEGKSLYDYIEMHDFDLVAILYSNGRTLEYLYDFKPQSLN